MVQIGCTGTGRDAFLKISKNSQKSQNSNFRILVHHFLHLCLLCIVKNFDSITMKLMEEIHFKFAPMAIAALALLQQHDARRDIVMEPASWRRATIEARGHSELRAFGTRGVIGL